MKAGYQKRRWLRALLGAIAFFASWVWAPLGLCASACSSTDEPGGRARGREGREGREIRVEEPEPERAPHEPARALAYAPDESPTGALIARGQAAVREHPEEVRGYTGLALLFLRRQRETGDPQMLRLADDALQGALSRDPREYRVRILEATVLHESHRFREAREVARELIREHRDQAAPLLLLGDAELELGNYEEAAEAYQRAVDLRPSLHAYNRGAHLRWLSGDVEGAIELLGEAIHAGSSHDPASTARCRIDLAEIRWSAGDAEAAEREITAALGLVEGYPPALRLRARILAAQGHRASAIPILERLLGDHPTVEDLLRLSEWAVAEGDPEGAARRLREAEAQEREDPRALALFYARHGTRTEDALRLSAQELRARRDLWAHDARALALARAGRHEEARREMEEALSLETPDPQLHLHAALVHHLAGNDEEARASFLRAEALNAAVDSVLREELTPISAGVSSGDAARDGRGEPTGDARR